jgi:hypothetical protein
MMIVRRSQLQYTRGSIIPLSMLFCSQDAQAMDLISSPDGISFRLVCIIDYVLGRKGKWTNKDMIANAMTMAGQPVYREITLVQTAVWRRVSLRSTSGANQHSPRRLFGEIHLRPDLAPPMETPDMRVYVSGRLFGETCIRSHIMRSTNSFYFHSIVPGFKCYRAIAVF